MASARMSAEMGAHPTCTSVPMAIHRFTTTKRVRAGSAADSASKMTFRLASQLPPLEEPHWVLNLLNNLARYVFKSGRWFEEYHWIPANGPIRADYPTDLVGLAFVLDPALAPIDTPHGRVEFVQAFGITSNELDRIKTKAATCEEVIRDQRTVNPLLVTDLDRRDAE